MNTRLFLGVMSLALYLQCILKCGHAKNMQVIVVVIVIDAAISVISGLVDCLGVGSS